MKASRLLVICWIFVSVLATFNTALTEAQTKEPASLEVGSWIERNIPLYMERARMPGFSIAVVKDGDQKLVPVGGIAFSGARGISKVEVRG